jgi:hypothetical protein
MRTLLFSTLVATLFMCGCTEVHVDPMCVDIAVLMNKADVICPVGTHMTTIDATIGSYVECQCDTTWILQ